MGYLLHHGKKGFPNTEPEIYYDLEQAVRAAHEMIFNKTGVPFYIAQEGSPEGIVISYGHDEYGRGVWEKKGAYDSTDEPILIVPINEQERFAEPEEELVNHPEHYNSHPTGIEAITIIEEFNFNLGSAVKYIWRHGLKPGETAIKDLEKARWYIEREIQRLTKPMRLYAVEDPAPMETMREPKVQEAL